MKLSELNIGESAVIDNGDAKLIMITFDNDNGNEKTLAAIKETEKLV